MTKTELDKLRERCKNQRTELRRLNKYLGPYWAGFRRGIDFELSKEIRIAMFKEFGQPAVFRAEHPCNCGQHKTGESTGGWYCPSHGQQL